MATRRENRITPALNWRVVISSVNMLRGVCAALGVPGLASGTEAEREAGGLSWAEADAVKERLARRSCGGACKRSVAYAVNWLLRLSAGTEEAVRVAPSLVVATISFQPAR